jgi:hypothetical protein
MFSIFKLDGCLSGEFYVVDAIFLGGFISEWVWNIVGRIDALLAYVLR